MLINGLYFDKEKNITIGSSFSSCYGCAVKYQKEHPGKTFAESCKAVAGKQIGQKLKAFPLLRSVTGDPVFLCHDCAEEIAEQIKPEE